MSGYPFLTLTGTARERGYQYGSQVPELIKKNIAFYRTMFEGFGVPWETAGKISKKFEPFIRRTSGSLEQSRWQSCRSLRAESESLLLKHY